MVLLELSQPVSGVRRHQAGVQSPAGMCRSGVGQQKGNGSPDTAWGPLPRLPDLHSCCLISFLGQPGKGGVCFHGSDTSLNIDLGKGKRHAFVLDPWRTHVETKGQQEAQM